MTRITGSGTRVGHYSRPRTETHRVTDPAGDPELREDLGLVSVSRGCGEKLGRGAQLAVLRREAEGAPGPSLRGVDRICSVGRVDQIQGLASGPILGGGLGRISATATGREKK